ncbi:MAG: tandem-95 repeat protein, partial [Chitinophagales bacterium]|nr:tandem-95 repeat protein [Chitinophagales bacterium]
IPDTTVTTCEDCPITVCIPYTDADVADLHAASVLCNPVNGTVSSVTVNNIFDQLCFTYTATTNFNGTDSLCIVLCDNGIPTKCDTTKITIVVTPVNDPPIANNDTYTTNEDTPLTISAPGVLANDSDPADGTAVSVVGVVSAPTNGVVTLNANGSFTYTPNANFSGTDVFCYNITDAGTPAPFLLDTACVTINVISVNDPPIVPDTTVTTPEDNPITVCVPISDVESATQIHTVTICDAPDNGTITFGPIVNNGTLPHTVCITYTPNPNFNGVDSICLTICDNGSPFLCDNTVITINVTPVNDPPIANNDTYTTNEDTPLNISAPGVLANDSDPADGTAVSVVGVVSAPTNGVVTLNANGSFTYTPNANFSGTDV